MNRLPSPQPNSVAKSLWSGLIRVVPIIVGYVPIGFAYGVLAKKAGISSLNTILMSIIVFAGSAQFIAIGLILAGATAVSIVITTFIVNLRHLLMSAALSPYLKKWKLFKLTAFSYPLPSTWIDLHKGIVIASFLLLST